MKEKYIAYYERYRGRAAFSFLWSALWTSNKIRRLALMNRFHDYLRLAENPALFALHRDLNVELLRSSREWKSYDYGEGYFYQGQVELGITGLRDTRGRVETLALNERLRGKRVLEIGCNTGFVALSVAEAVDRIDGFDINPFLINVARRAATHLGRTRASFAVSSFEEWPACEPYDAVLSFANHSTYDGNTRQPLVEYFARCHAALKPGGELLFESHPPDYEGGRLQDVLRILEDRFEIREQRVLDYGSFLDRGRTFVAGIRR